VTIYYPSSGRGVERGNLGSLFPPTGGLKKSGILVSDLKTQRGVAHVFRSASYEEKLCLSKRTTS